MRAFSNALALLTALLVACGGSQPDNAGLSDLDAPPDEAAAAAAEREGITPNDQAVLTIVDLNIDSTLTEGCGTTAPASPMFQFDSEALTPDAAARIKRIGECLATGPLAQSQIMLVGHTDPRGSGEYNQKLAASRAEQVARLLTAEGVARDRITIDSQGERAAKADPDHWKLERRVDIAVKLPEGVVDAADVEAATN